MMDLIVVKCPYCKSIVTVDYHKDLAICEDCGTHPGDECPKCYNIIDLLFAEEIEDADNLDRKIN